MDIRYEEAAHDEDGLKPLSQHTGLEIAKVCLYESDIRTFREEFIDLNMVKAMGPENRIVVDGLAIHFPYKPYACQIEYMTEVVRALNSKNHGALESPTGTGKTLCLLTASLAWLHNYSVKANKGAKRIQIIYTSRTHS